MKANEIILIQETVLVVRSSLLNHATVFRGKDISIHPGAHRHRGREVQSRVIADA